MSAARRGNKKLKIESIPVLTNAITRESRLFKSTPEHVLKSAAALIRSFMVYRLYVIFLMLRLAGLRPADAPGGRPAEVVRS